MGKGGTRFVGDAVGVRGKAKGYSGKDMKKVGACGCCWAPLVAQPLRGTP